MESFSQKFSVPAEVAHCAKGTRCKILGEEDIKKEDMVERPLAVVI